MIQEQSYGNRLNEIDARSLRENRKDMRKTETQCPLMPRIRHPLTKETLNDAAHRTPFSEGVIQSTPHIAHPSTTY